MTELSALLISLAIEVPIVFALVWLFGLPRRSSWTRVAVFAFATTCITHWPAWNAFTWLAPYLDYWPCFFVVEGCVVLVEGALYAWPGRLGWRYGMLISLAANGASAGFGVLLWAL